MARRKVGLQKSISSILQGAPLPGKLGSGLFKIKAPGSKIADYVPPKPLPPGRLATNMGKGGLDLR